MLNWAYQCLEKDDDVIVPIKRLWSRKYRLAGTMSFEDFARRVTQDARFEVMYSIEQDPALEAFGCFSGPRVKLRSRKITVACVRRMLQKHNERILQTLQRAAELAEQDSDPERNNNLTEAIQMLDWLRPFFKPWINLGPKDQTT